MTSGNNNTEATMTKLMINAESKLNDIKPGTVRVVDGFAIARFSNGTFGIGNVNGENAETLIEAARTLARRNSEREAV
jgi:hypothetical protein